MYGGDENVCRQAALWLDQHAPLLLALERGDTVLSSDGHEIMEFLLPCRNTPMYPDLPDKSMWMIPMLWSSRNQNFLQAHPVLKLLYVYVFVFV